MHLSEEDVQIVKFQGKILDIMSNYTKVKQDLAEIAAHPVRKAVTKRQAATAAEGVGKAEPGLGGA